MLNIAIRFTNVEIGHRRFILFDLLALVWGLNTINMGIIRKRLLQLASRCQCFQFAELRLFCLFVCLFLYTAWWPHGQLRVYRGDSTILSISVTTF